MSRSPAYPIITPLERFMRCLRELEGLPYLWGGKTLAGLDCSGAVTLALFLAGGPDLRRTCNTDTMWALWEYVPEDEAQPGDLAIYGRNELNPNDVNHVMVLMPDGRVFGAAGGGSKTTTVDIARKTGARVQYRPTVRYRGDFRGFRRLPL